MRALVRVPLCGSSCGGRLACGDSGGHRGPIKRWGTRLLQGPNEGPACARALASGVYPSIVPLRARDCAQDTVLGFLRSCPGRSQSHRTSTQVVAPARRRRRTRAGSARHIHDSHRPGRARHETIGIVPVPPRAPLQVYQSAFLTRSARYRRVSWFTYSSRASRGPQHFSAGAR